MATNYEKYFGSPERAALTLNDMEIDVSKHGAADIAEALNLVCHAPLDEECMRGHETLEWLQEECND